MFAGAPLSAIQTVCITTAIPFAAVTIIFVFKGKKWLKEEVVKLERNEEERVFAEIFERMKSEKKE